MLLSNKAILGVLWSRYKGHPNLLPTVFEPLDGYIKKPILGREGANIQRNGSLMEGSHFVEDYDEGYVYQEYCPLPNIYGQYALAGSWAASLIAPAYSFDFLTAHAARRCNRQERRLTAAFIAPRCGACSRRRRIFISARAWWLI